MTSYDFHLLAEMSIQDEKVYTRPIKRERKKKKEKNIRKIS